MLFSQTYKDRITYSIRGLIFNQISSIGFKLFRLHNDPSDHAASAVVANLGFTKHQTDLAELAAHHADAVLWATTADAVLGADAATNAACVNPSEVAADRIATQKDRGDVDGSNQGPMKAACATFVARAAKGSL